MKIQHKLDSYKQWIISIHTTPEGWEAKVFPSGIFQAENMNTLILFIGKYVMNEVIILVADALLLTSNQITNPPTRERVYADARMVAACVLYDKFPASQQLVCSLINWKNHSSYIHARNQVANIAELQEKKEKVFKMYPFLNGNKEKITV